MRYHSDSASPNLSWLSFYSAFSFGSWVVCAIALVSFLFLFLSRSAPDKQSLDMWVFARPHHDLYMLDIQSQFQSQPNKLNVALLSLPALERRMLSGFFSGTP